MLFPDGTIAWPSTNGQSWGYFGPALLCQLSSQSSNNVQKKINLLNINKWIKTEEKKNGHVSTVKRRYQI